MRPITVQVGPLAATGTTKIALSQSPAGAGWLALNGAYGSFSANGIALSQSITGATAVILNGKNSQTIPQTGTTGAITGSYAQRIYITSAGNDSGVTFAVKGLDRNGAAVSETITGANTGVSGFDKPILCDNEHHSVGINGVHNHGRIFRRGDNGYAAPGTYHDSIDDFFHDLRDRLGRFADLRNRNEFRIFGCFCSQLRDRNGDFQFRFGNLDHGRDEWRCGFPMGSV